MYVCVSAFCLAGLIQIKMVQYMSWPDAEHIVLSATGRGLAVEHYDLRKFRQSNRLINALERYGEKGDETTYV